MATCDAACAGTFSRVNMVLYVLLAGRFNFDPYQDVHNVG
jgi:hypothetical protein